MLDFEKLQGTTLCTPDEGGEAGVPPGADVLRPGGSLGLLTGLVVDTYARQQRVSEVSTNILVEWFYGSPLNFFFNEIVVFETR